MSLRPGTFHELKVERNSPFGYFLSDGNEDVLLHYAEADKERKIEIGDIIEVYLYTDHKGRIAATLNDPIIAYGEANFLKVKDFQRNIGFFLDNGIGKQILLPTKELPSDINIWPAIGGLLFVTLDYDKEGRLLAKLITSESDFNDYIAELEHDEDEENGYLNPTQIRKSEFIDGIVFHHLSVGAQIYLPRLRTLGFLHHSEQTHELRLGEKVSVRIAFIRDDERINLAMRPLKQESMSEDAEKIVQILSDRGGAMPYWDKTPADIIESKLKMSKSAFKRAIGRLLKENKIYQEEGWTYLKNRDELS